MLKLKKKKKKKKKKKDFIIKHKMTNELFFSI